MEPPPLPPGQDCSPEGTMPPPLPEGCTVSSNPAPPPGVPPRKQSKWMWLWCILGGLVFVGVGTLSEMGKIVNEKTQPGRESTEERNAQVSAAFVGEPRGAGTPEWKAAKALLADMGAGISRGDSSAIEAGLDMRRVVRELQRIPGYPKLSAKEEEVSIGKLRAGLASKLANAGIQWHRVEIRSVQVSREGGDMIVYSRHQVTEPGDPKHYSMYYRWWMARSGGNWRIYDMDNIDLGVRLTTTIGLMVTKDGMTARQFGDARVTLGDLMKIHRHVVAGQLDAAEEALNAVEKKSCPLTIVRSLKLVCRGQLRLQQGRYAEVARDMEELLALSPESVGAHGLWASALAELGQYEKALEHIRAYEKILGETAETTAIAGKALAGLGQADEAAAAYRRGLADDPDSQENVIGLAGVVPAAERTDVMRRFAVLSKPRDCFTSIADTWVRSGDPAGLAALIEAYGRIDPGNPAVKEYQKKLDGMKAPRRTQSMPAKPE